MTTDEMQALAESPLLARCQDEIVRLRVAGIEPAYLAVGNWLPTGDGLVHTDGLVSLLGYPVFVDALLVVGEVQVCAPNDEPFVTVRV